MAFRMVYTPPDGERQEWRLVLEDLRRSEVEAIEDLENVPWQTMMGWASMVAAGSFKAWRAALWVMMRRTNPALDFDEMPDFKVGDLNFLEEDDEQPELKLAEPEGKGEAGDSDTNSP